MTERHSRPSNPSDEDTGRLNLDRTQPLSTGQLARVTPPQVPPPAGAQRPVRPSGSPATGNYPPRPERRTRRRSARESGLYLPWWSLLIMLLSVFAVAFGVVMLIYTLGNREPNTQREPIIRIITAEPSTLNQASIPGNAASPSESQTILGGQTQGNLALEGPTLAPIIFTPTPAPVTVGASIVVQGVGAQKLNVRDAPGVIGTNVIFRSDEGERFVILDGPSQADGFTWWRIQNLSNTSQTGWAVANYLSVVASDS